MPFQCPSLPLPPPHFQPWRHCAQSSHIPSCNTKLYITTLPLRSFRCLRNYSENRCSLLSWGSYIQSRTLTRDFLAHTGSLLQGTILSKRNPFCSVVHGARLSKPVAGRTSGDEPPVVVYNSDSHVTSAKNALQPGVPRVLPLGNPSVETPSVALEPTLSGLLSPLKSTCIVESDGFSRGGLLEAAFSGVEVLGEAMSTEEAVGILCYANRMPGFTGVLKHRYVDFVVNEVTLEGEVVHLTSLSVPKVLQQAPPPEPGTAPPALLPNDFGISVKSGADSSSGSEPVLTDLTPVIEAFKKVASSTDAGLLQGFLQKITEKGREGVLNDPLLFSESDDKVYRTGLHMFMKEQLPFLISDTVDAPQGPPFRCVRARVKPGPRGRGDRRNNTGSERNQGGADRNGGGGDPSTTGLRASESEIAAQALYKGATHEDYGHGGGRGGKRARWEERGEYGGRGRGKKPRREWGRGGTGWGTPDAGEGQAAYDHRGGNGPDAWANRGKYLQFHLYKENVDTQHAIGILARQLGVQTKCFGFAGTKDKRAVTVQRVTVFRQSAEKVAALNSRLFNIRAGDFRYVEDAVKLGQLGGNRFTITLRGVEAANEGVIKSAASELKSSGFINYFGLQRFGVGSIPTHAVGAALLKGEWKKAVDLLLLPRERPEGEVAEDQRDDVLEARQIWAKTNDPRAALAIMPRHCTAERALLEGIQKFGPSNLVQALGCIPRTLRMMYVHAYQSFLWNHAASHRVRQQLQPGDAGSNKRGLSVMAGDLVVVSDDDALPSEEGSKTGEGTDIAEDDDVVPDEGEEGRPLKKLNVKVATAEDISLNRYNIDDVVLPLPGSTVLYPANDTGKVFQEMAEKDGIDLRKCSHNVKEYSVEKLAGDYRRLLLKPRDYSWKILHYDDATSPLVETDLDRILQRKVATSSPLPQPPPLPPVQPQESVDPGSKPASEPEKLPLSGKTIASISAALADQPPADSVIDAGTGSFRENSGTGVGAGKRDEPAEGAGAETEAGSAAAAAVVEEEEAAGLEANRAAEGRMAEEKLGGHGGVAGGPVEAEVLGGLGEKGNPAVTGEIEAAGEKGSGCEGQVADVRMGQAGEREGGGEGPEKQVAGKAGQYTALVLELTLPSSCYATMAIRELLKISSAVAFHKTLHVGSEETKKK
eukprot:TRINITY_DN32409_c0_g1_i1.p1 TRINITY_DN32409_c0_g1~~TRINITY_DN32409_c0_g1_i1.p1  ORF type:complete len:1158 (+),score=223.73 TRINITY_DN32409_c0_g1_i1:246-3719(+)